MPATLAAVHLFLGEPEHAVHALGDWLAASKTNTAAYLEIDPTYDSLRDREDFQALLTRESE